MKKNRQITGRINFGLTTALLGAFTGTVYAQPAIVGASVSVAVPGIEIRAESDFYEPLAPQGEWVVVGSYGRCWRPARVARDWRPYCNGNWQRTDAGWYWVSDEPWAWATYHYGRWDYTDQYGWYWVPQTQWAPAWVSWHEGGGYVGWAPLQPSVTISVNGFVGFNQARIAPRAYVFVEQRRFLEPIRPTTVVINNTTIINKTVIISNTKVVNNTVINEGPKTQVIAQSSGRQIQETPVRELRRTQEAPVVARQKATAPAIESNQKNVQTPVRGGVDPAITKTVVASTKPPVETPVVTRRAPAPVRPTGQVRERETARPTPSQQPESRRETPLPGRAKDQSESKPAKYAEPSERVPNNSEKKAPGKPVRPEKEKPVATEKNVRSPGEQRRDQKAEEHQAPEKSAGPRQSSP